MLERAGVGSSLRSGAGCWEALVVALPAAAGGVCSGSSPTGSPKCQAKKADGTHEALWFSNYHLCVDELHSRFGACSAFLWVFFPLG